MELNQIENEIKSIKERNATVEGDKAWETSSVRKIFIAAATYIIAATWLILINDTNTWLKALVPVAGYLLSTMSLPFIKKWWIANHFKK